MINHNVENFHISTMADHVRLHVSVTNLALEITLR